jgi:hypothetical protein
MEVAADIEAELDASEPPRFTTTGSEIMVRGDGPEGAGVDNTSILACSPGEAGCDGGVDGLVAAR